MEVQLYPSVGDQQLATQAGAVAHEGQQTANSTATGAVALVAAQPAQPNQERGAAADFIPLEESVDDATTAQGKKQKNPAKVKCHRCGVVGHFAIDCITELCNNCELPGHADDDCPLLAAPKPHMIMMNVLVVDGFYDLTFEVEVLEGTDEEMQEAASGEGNDPDDDDPAGGDDKGKQKENKDTEHVQKSDVNKASTVVPTKYVEKDGPTGTQNSQVQCSGVRFSPLVQRMLDTSRCVLLESATLGLNSKGKDLVSESEDAGEKVLEHLSECSLRSGKATEVRVKEATANALSPVVAAAVLNPAAAEFHVTEAAVDQHVILQPTVLSAGEKCKCSDQDVCNSPMFSFY
ncbi:hypothetical protein ACQ4PT_061099 [Festuca glaucescens]